jgi:hypothetical protein
MNLKDMHNLEYKYCVYFSHYFQIGALLLDLPKQMAWDVDSSRYNMAWDVDSSRYNMAWDVDSSRYNMAWDVDSSRYNMDIVI